MADYDVVFIGAGPGGYVGAIRAAQLGAKAAVVENRQLGGVCLNRGCIPTKIYLHTADLLHEGNHAAEYGLNFGEPTVDFARLNQKRDSIVGGLRKGVAGLLKKNKVDHIQGTAGIDAPGKVRIQTDEGEKVVTAANIVIATGSEPAKPSIFPFDGKRILTSDEILQLSEIPKSLIVVGGGYIGCEYAGFFNQMGTEVTIIEMLDQLVPTMDTDVASELAKNFQKAGIKIHTSAKAEDLKATAKGVSCKVDGKEIKAELAMVATGRKHNSDIAGVKELGIKLDGTAIAIDDRCQTSVDGIYAIGDVTGKYMLAHVASHMGIVAAENITGHPRRMDYRVVPAVFFTRPQISSVGMTEKEATAASIDYKVAKFNFRGLGMAHVLNEPNGYVKIIGNKKTGEILGCQIIGLHATELIEEMAVAIKLQATVEEITRTIHPHPTLSESMLEACESWLGLGIHS